MLQPGRPRHEQISDWLRQKIDSGEWQADALLPSEKQLGDQFDVSRITVRRALQTLESEGRIYRKQGLGSFVRGERLSQGLVRLTDFIEDMAQAGLEPSSRVVRFEPVLSGQDVVEALGLPEKKQVILLERLRLGDGAPIAFDCTWMPVLYGHLLEGKDLEKETIYHILESEFDIPITSGRFRIEAVAASEQMAEHLHVEIDTPLLLIERISFSGSEKRIYFQRRYYRSDRVAFEMELERHASSAGPVTNGMPLREFEPVFKRSTDPK